MKNALLIISFAVLASCSSPASDAPEPQPAAQKPAPTVALSQRCTNERHGFTVSYPAGWHTNGGEVIPACTAFDPGLVQIPPQSEMPFEIAVVVDVHQEAFDRTPDPQFERVLSSERLMIGGRPALRAEVEATGEGLAERGMRTLRYAIDLGDGRTLVASTNRTGEEYEREKEILRRMVEAITVPTR